MNFGQNSINMPHGKNNCATWNDLTPFKINDEDPICNLKYIYYVATWHFVMGHNIVVNNGE